MAKAVIAGGGIAGIAAALALARDGWEVSVYEAAPAPSEVGAGLQMSPNAARVLRDLGVLGAVAGRAFRPRAAVLRDGRTGTRIFGVELGATAEARWGAPYLHVHRADLLEALSVAARQAGAAIFGGSPVLGYLLRPEGPVLKLAGGETVGGDIVIGADGIRSVLRAQINGPEAPEFSGQVAWRGTVPAERLPESLVAPDATVWAGDGRHLVTYYVRDGALVNFVAAEEKSAWTEESWSVAGNPASLRASFSGWHPGVTGFLDRVTDTFLWGLFTRPAQVRWVDAGVCLIGDAAHPMLPFMAQGAAMALEDVAVLAAVLRSDRTINHALLTFEELRWPRVTRVQQRSRANGDFFHRSPGPIRSAHRGMVAAVSRVAPGMAAGQLDWLYGYDSTKGTA